MENASGQDRLSARENKSERFNVLRQWRDYAVRRRRHPQNARPIKPTAAVKMLLGSGTATPLTVTAVNRQLPETLL